MVAHGAVMDEMTLPTGLTSPDPSKAVRKPRKKELKNLMRREGIWYFHKFVNGKREFNGRATPFSLQTGDLVVAKARRDAVLRAADGVAIDRALGRENRGAAKLGEIFARYRKAPTVRANVRTRESNINDLTRLVRMVRGAEFNVDMMSSADLTKALVKEWQSIRLEKALADFPTDRPAQEAAKRTANSLLTHVQSIFSAEARDDYGALYLPPNIREFMDALPVPARKQEEPKQLADDMVTALWVAAEQLAKDDFAAWTVFQLMLWGGLRNKECVHARTGWLAPSAHGYRLAMQPAGDFLPKGNSRAVTIPVDVAELILAHVAENNRLRAAGGFLADDHLVVADTVTQRERACYRTLNNWLRAAGVGEDAGKIAYRLRKYFLSKVNEQQGIMLAQAAAGHSSSKTTRDHYVGAEKMQQPIRL
jgi:integrase